MRTFASDNGFSVEKMNKENIKALRSETEALRMLIVGIEKRLEQQKILLARALVQEPKLLLLDEPTSSLDLKNQYEVLGLVRRFCRERGITAILVIHDLNLALRFCDRFLFLHGGRVLAFGGPEAVTPANIRAVYGMDVAVEQVRGVPVVIPAL